MAYPKGAIGVGFIDRSGRRYGRLTVIGLRRHAKPSGKTIVQWQCRCDCGNERWNAGCDLESGKVVSCGCYRTETTVDRCTTHGSSKTPEFMVWAGLLDRCSRAKSKSYKNYGARGIGVCPEWRASFDAFLSDMGSRPGAEYTIERLDNDGDYEPSNCIWATRTVQARNKRNTCLTPWLVRDLRAAVAGDGSIFAWAKAHQIPYTTAARAAHGETWKDIE